MPQSFSQQNGSVYSMFNTTCGQYNLVNSLPNDKVLDWSKLKALADDKITVAQKLKFVHSRVENNVGKGENAGY